VIGPGIQNLGLGPRCMVGGAKLAPPVRVSAGLVALVRIVFLGNGWVEERRSAVGFMVGSGF
jgi:hypothetical protein